MPDKIGSSSYGTGDAGGAHGDYEHGVSHGMDGPIDWLKKKFKAAVTSKKQTATGPKNRSWNDVNRALSERSSQKRGM